MLDTDGDRILQAPIGTDSKVYKQVVEQGAVYTSTIIDVEQYYSVYPPIVHISEGQVLGLLFVGVSQGAITTVVTETMSLLLIVSCVAVAAMCAASILISRSIARPIPVLSGAMRRIAKNEFDVAVPYTDRQNELGDMARAVEVFRLIGQKVAQMTEAEASRIVAEEQSRRTMMREWQAAFRNVVRAAIAGNLTQKVDATSPTMNSICSQDP